MAAVTQLAASRFHGTRRYGSFAGKEASAAAVTVAAGYDGLPARTKRKYRLIEPDGRVRVFKTRAEMERRIAELLEDEEPEAVEKVEQPVKRSPKKRGKSWSNQPVAAPVPMLTFQAQMALDALIEANAALQMSMILNALRGAQNDDEDALMAILAVAA